MNAPAHGFVFPIETLDLRLTQQGWRFAEDRRPDIENHWAKVVAEKPQSWNGEILLAYSAAMIGTTCEVRCFRTDYASFHAWRDWGAPDKTVRNCFGSALVVSSDGALLYGRMSGHTLNAGLVYPPGGSLEPRDVRRDGSIALLDSIAHELAEETGLDARNATSTGLWAAFDRHRLAIGQALRFPQTADELAAAVARHLASQDLPELERPMVLRRAADLEPAMPAFGRMFASLFLT